MTVMPIGSVELARLESVLESAEMLIPDFQDLARSESARRLLNLSNEHDFVLGAAYAYVMSTFAVAGKPNYNEIEAIELLSVVLLRLSTIDRHMVSANAAKARHDISLEDLR